MTSYVSYSTTGVQLGQAKRGPIWTPTLQGASLYFDDVTGNLNWRNATKDTLRYDCSKFSTNVLPNKYFQIKFC